MKSRGPQRLVCVVEGKGEVQALPNLCSRIAHYLGVTKDQWVMADPIKYPRSRLVDERQPTPNRSPRTDLVEKAVELACREGADGIVLICDADDDCAAVWGPQAATLVSSRLKGGAVMVEREYEAWLLAAFQNQPTWQKKAIQSLRDAKGPLKSVVPGYKPSTHQLELTRRIDVGRLRDLSDSFDKLVRTLAAIFDVDCPPREAEKGQQPRTSAQRKKPRSVNA
ncbi:MAG: hypothetical protein RJA70_2426 [Pseudomonadota bacterium]